MPANTFVPRHRGPVSERQPEGVGSGRLPWQGRQKQETEIEEQEERQLSSQQISKACIIRRKRKPT